MEYISTVFSDSMYVRPVSNQLAVIQNLSLTMSPV